MGLDRGKWKKFQAYAVDHGQSTIFHNQWFRRPLSKIETFYPNACQTE